MSSVDWRNRFGSNWITSVRDQNGCGACWAFAATALVESTVRIEHAFWSTRSEGDLHKGMGWQCPNGGNVEAAIDWVADNGLADPDCFPWDPAESAHTPSADRSGRTVRTPKGSWVGSVQDQKTWLDAVGTLATYFSVYTDFFAYGSGVYHRQASVSVGGQANFGQIWDGRPFWIGDFDGDGRADVLFYYPGDKNWWLGRFTGGQLAWSLVGNTTGFGQIWDGRPFWIGNFTSAGKSEVLFYYPGDQNWWLGSWNGNELAWTLADNTAGFGQVGDGRPIWIGDFDGDGRADVLFYYPGDKNWWLGRFTGSQINWTLAGKTSGFGQVWDGRPFWINKFSVPNKAEVLFYYPGDKNWWLGTFNGATFDWNLADNTAGFGQVGDGRPIWTADFTGDGRADVLFYYPGDMNWWLGTFAGTQLSWNLADNTAGFGQVGDGRPIWTADFTGDGRADILFYYPGDMNWWLGTFANKTISWTLASNTTGFGDVWDGRPIWVGNFASANRAEVLFYYPGDGNWWLASWDGSQLPWRLVGNTGAPNKFEGGHVMLVVGYDDADGCWIVKNSWGPWWGENGFARIGYGECDIDAYSKLGLRGTNPDPWTKRRLHSGNAIESGNGQLHRNFELLATASDAGAGVVRHWWRDGSNFAWNSGETFADDAAVCPSLTASTFNRNFETVYLTTNGRLHHWYYEQDRGTWRDGGVFGPGDAAGVPGFVQTNRDAPGDFEVVVRTGDGKLNDWNRNNSALWAKGPGEWVDRGRFGTNIQLSGASLVQTRAGASGLLELGRGELSVVCVLNSGEMQRWSRSAAGGSWTAQEKFGAGIGSVPCMIEGQFDAENELGVGNFELCVAAAGSVQHWWRDNNGSGQWFNSATFGHDVLAVAGLLEGSFGFNLELIALRTDNQLQHYWRDGSGWHEGPIIGGA
jgi:Papain family cysteine protease/FG-GAP-like repeat